MKNWKVESIDKEYVKGISEEFNIPIITSILLFIRGIREPDEIQKFLYENEELDDPFLTIDMDKATQRIFFALNNKERICIYGDYDADGVTSTALLYSYLDEIGADVTYYIPSRETEGYGMNNSAVDKISQTNTKLIITVDNGISAGEQIDYAKSLGIDTIVTDHHTPPENLPNAVAVINPHRKDCPSEFKYLSGVGVVFKLIMALEDENLDMTRLLNKYSDIAALGTIGDIVSLTGENRILVKSGLKNIINLNNIGISALLDTAGLKGNKKITAGKLSFTIVPRINACGRLALSEKSVELLLTNDYNNAKSIAQELAEDNTIRQNIEKEILEEVLLYIDNNPHIKYRRVMVISGDNWHQGVIGIVASRVKDIYGKPTIIITKDGENAKGSGRSIDGFSLIEGITTCNDILPHFGGHPMAVGLSIKTTDIEEFSIRLNEYANLQGKMPLPELRIDCKLNPKCFTVELARQISVLEPFGSGNPTPVFGLYNMLLENITPVGGGNHLRLTLSRDKVKITAMQFFTKAEQFPYKVGDILDIAVNIDINDYNNKQSLSIIIKDIKPNNLDTGIVMEDNEIFERLMNLEKLSTDEIEKITPTRDDFAEVFRFLRKERKWEYPPYIICSRINNPRINYGRLQVILLAMHQLSLIDYSQKAGKNSIKILPVKGKSNLNNAKIMQRLKNLNT